MNPKTERKPLDFYLAKSYPFIVYPSEEGGYSAEIPDLPGCLTEGENLEELSTHIEEARRAWIEVAYEEGLEIPLPRNEEVYSGRFVVRLPKYLHRHLAEEADREGVSLNQLVLSLVSARLSERETIATAKRVVEEALVSGKARPFFEQPSQRTWQSPGVGDLGQPRKGRGMRLVAKEALAA